MTGAITSLGSAMKRHGGKHFFAAKYIRLFPNHTHYIEPYFGAGSTLLRKPTSLIEVAADIDPDLINAWQVIRDQSLPLQSALAELDYEEYQFDYSLEKLRAIHARPKPPESPNLPWAAHFLVVNRMSRGGKGHDFAASGAGPTRLRRGLPDNVSAWRGAIERLPIVAARIRHVTFTCQPALSLIEAYRHQTGAVIFLDPPYLPSTRTSKDDFDYDMTEIDHMALLSSIMAITEATVFLCGYPSDLYTQTLTGWHVRKWETVNHSGQSRAKQTRTECLWSNRPFYGASRAL